MKDNFSLQADQYAKYRPTYPVELFNFLYSITPNKQNAWDCGTGNGQVAYELSKTFDHVSATDISQTQIENAIQEANITYSIQPAEKTNFQDKQFDLIVIAQAIHWFDFDQFYAEVRRTARENTILGIIGYGRAIISDEIDQIITHFYDNIIGIYWDKERTYIDENYQTIPFPFDEIQAPSFVNRHLWTLDHLIGYIGTWSAVKHFIKQNGYNPVDALRIELELHWDKQEEKEVKFPLLLRVGRI